MPVPGLAPVTLALDCGGARHEVHWAEGVLTAPAHPETDRERALAALGADPAPCVQLLDAWTRHADDLDVLVLGSRGPGDELDQALLWFGARPGVQYMSASRYSAASLVGGFSPVARPRTVKGGWTAFRPLAAQRYRDLPASMAADQLPTLLALGSGLPHRLAATVIATWVQRVEAGDERVAAAAPRLDAAVYGRVRASLLPWLGAPAPLEFSLLSPGGRASIRRDGDTVQVALPFSWLRDVWVPGLAVLLDRFVIAAEAGPHAGWRLTTVTRELAGPQVLTITG